MRSTSSVLELSVNLYSILEWQRKYGDMAISSISFNATGQISPYRETGSILVQHGSQTLFSQSGYLNGRTFTLHTPKYYTSGRYEMEWNDNSGNSGEFEILPTDHLHLHGSGAYVSWTFSPGPLLVFDDPKDEGEFVGGVIGYAHETLTLKETGTLDVSRKRYLVDTDMKAKLKFKNTGSFTWNDDDYDLAIGENSSPDWSKWYFDGLEFPAGEVAPGETVEFDVEFETFSKTKIDDLEFAIVTTDELGRPHAVASSKTASVKSQAPIDIIGAAGQQEHNGPLALTLERFQVAWDTKEGPMPTGSTIATITRLGADWGDDDVELGTKSLNEWIADKTVLTTGVYEIDYIFSVAEEEEFYESGSPRAEWILNSGVTIGIASTVDLQMEADRGGIDSEGQVTYFEPGAVVTFTAKAKDGYSWGNAYDADPVVWTGSSSLIGSSDESETLTVVIPNNLTAPLELSTIAYNLDPKVETFSIDQFARQNPKRSWLGGDNVVNAYLGRDGVEFLVEGRDRESTLSSVEVQYRKPDGVWEAFATSGVVDSSPDRRAEMTVRGMIGEVDPEKTLIPIDWEEIGDKTWTFRVRLTDSSGSVSGWTEIPVNVVTPLRTVEKTVRTLAPDDKDGWFNDSAPRTDTFKVWIE